MARDSSLKDKVGCLPIIIMALFVFGLGVVWTLRGPLFGMDDETNLMSWLGLQSEEVAAAEPESEPEKEEKETKYFVKLEDPPKESQNLNQGEGLGLGQDAGTVELNEAVKFEVVNPSGKATTHVLPRGTIMEYTERQGNLLRVRLMGREGWLPAAATRSGAAEAEPAATE